MLWCVARGLVVLRPGRRTILSWRLGGHLMAELLEDEEAKDSAVRAMRMRRKEGKGSEKSSSTEAQIWAALKKVRGPESL